MRCAIFCIGLSCIGIPTTYGVSKNVLDVQSFYNGYWENTPQVQKEGHGHDYVQGWAIPVDVPALRPNAATLVKEFSNGVLRIFNLLEMYDGAENNTVVAKIYNFPDISTEEARTYDLDKLKTLRREDLKSTDDCFAVFDVSNEGFVVANYPYCKYTFNGKHPRFSLHFACNTSFVSFPQDTDQASPMSPYVARHIGPRYPLINPPKDYPIPCAN